VDQARQHRYGSPERPRFARLERARLCDLFTHLGPAVPTLCTGWTTADLAAHLVTRERRPDAVVGIVLKRWSGYADGVRRGVLGRNEFDHLVGLVRHGPPRWILPPFDDAMNALEFFVHHEDVRRARPGWEPRHLGREHEIDLWRRLTGTARLLFRRSPVRVVLGCPYGERVVGARTAAATVTVTGPSPELVIFAFGRQDQARVDLQGPPGAAAEVRRMRLGV